MILNALIECLRAFMFAWCELWVSPMTVARRSRTKGALRSVPLTRAGRFVGIMSSVKVVLILPIFWFAAGLGSFHKSLSKWFYLPERKPPDPKVLKDRLRRRRVHKLKQALRLVATMPVFLRGNEMEFGLSSYDETSNMSIRRAEQVRERLKDVDPLVSETLDGILTVCSS